MKNPDIVYKYRNWKDDFHKNILYKNQLHLTSPKDFNDPFDCCITENFLLLDDDIKIKEFVDQAINRQAKELVSQGRDLEKERIELIKNFDVNEIQNKVLEDAPNERNMHGILSLSTRWNSVLMWSHYGDFHRGFCIGFDEKKLRESGKFGFWGYVKYDNEMPKIDPREYFNIESHFKKTYSKSIDWSYEKEYRLMKNFYCDKDECNRIITVRDDCFREIILGMDISGMDKEAIISIANKKGIKIFQATKISDKFELNRYEI